MEDAKHAQSVKSKSQLIKDSAEFSHAELTKFNFHLIPQAVEDARHAQEIWFQTKLELSASDN
jgi:hypothetical protein